MSKERLKLQKIMQHEFKNSVVKKITDKSKARSKKSTNSGRQRARSSFLRSSRQNP